METTHRKTLIERLRVRRSEEGLALLDVLIGMAIFALIALIALSALGQYRQKAFITGTTSDAKAVGVAIEAEGVTRGADQPAFLAGDSTAATPDTDYCVLYNTTTAPTSCGGAAPAAPAVRVNVSKVTKGNKVVNYAKVTNASGVTGFVFCIQHQSGGTNDAYTIYNSTKGGVAPGAFGAGACPATTDAAYAAG